MAAILMAACREDTHPWNARLAPQAWISIWGSNWFSKRKKTSYLVWTSRGGVWNPQRFDHFSRFFFRDFEVGELTTGRALPKRPPPRCHFCFNCLRQYWWRHHQTTAPLVKISFTLRGSIFSLRIEKYFFRKNKPLEFGYRIQSAGRLRFRDEFNRKWKTKDVKTKTKDGKKTKVKTGKLKIANWSLWSSQWNFKHKNENSRIPIPNIWFDSWSAYQLMDSSITHCEKFKFSFPLLSLKSLLFCECRWRWLRSRVNLDKRGLQKIFHRRHRDFLSGCLDPASCSVCEWRGRHSLPSLLPVIGGLV